MPAAPGKRREASASDVAQLTGVAIVVAAATWRIRGRSFFRSGNVSDVEEAESKAVDPPDELVFAARSTYWSSAATAARSHSNAAA